jgi:hypothetical protein
MKQWGNDGRVANREIESYGCYVKRDALSRFKIMRPNMMLGYVLSIPQLTKHMYSRVLAWMVETRALVRLVRAI